MMHEGESNNIKKELLLTMFHDVHGILHHMFTEAFILRKACTPQFISELLQSHEDVLFQIKDHFKEHEAPIVIMDQYGITWCCIKDQGYCVLGPVYTLGKDTDHLYKMFDTPQTPFEKSVLIRKYAKEIPAIPYQALISLLSMFQYAVSEKKVSNVDISFRLLLKKAPLDIDLTQTTWHGSQELEKSYYQAIRDGCVDQLQKAYTFSMNVTPGNISQDPLLQAKYICISCVTLSARAAIDGGTSYEGALNISDHYFRIIDAAKSIGELTQCMHDMVLFFAERVHMCKNDSNISPFTRDVREYIRTNVTQKLSLENISHAMGYSKYYLSERYYKESSEHISDAIKRIKIEFAKEYL